MRLISASSIVFILALTLGISGVDPTAAGDRAIDRFQDDQGSDQRRGQQEDGRRIFRFDTFGDEQFWTDVLRMHEVVATVSPATALAVGLKVDVEALPRNLLELLAARQVNLDDPAV